jgi:hypothetical protein
MWLGGEGWRRAGGQLCSKGAALGGLCHCRSSSIKWGIFRLQIFARSCSWLKGTFCFFSARVRNSGCFPGVSLASPGKGPLLRDLGPGAMRLPGTFSFLSGALQKGSQKPEWFSPKSWDPYRMFLLAESRWLNLWCGLFSPWGKEEMVPGSIITYCVTHFCLRRVLPGHYLFHTRCQFLTYPLEVTEETGCFPQDTQAIGRWLVFSFCSVQNSRLGFLC